MTRFLFPRYVCNKIDMPMGTSVYICVSISISINSFFLLFLSIYFLFFLSFMYQRASKPYKLYIDNTEYGMSKIFPMKIHEFFFIAESIRGHVLNINEVYILDFSVCRQMLQPARGQDFAGGQKNRTDGSRQRPDKVGKGCWCRIKGASFQDPLALRLLLFSSPFFSFSLRLCYSSALYFCGRPVKVKSRPWIEYLRRREQLTWYGKSATAVIYWEGTESVKK